MKICNFSHTIPVQKSTICHQSIHMSIQREVSGICRSDGTLAHQARLKMDTTFETATQYYTLVRKTVVELIGLPLREGLQSSVEQAVLLCMNWSPHPRLSPKALS